MRHLNRMTAVCPPSAAVRLRSSGAKRLLDFCGALVLLLVLSPLLLGLAIAVRVKLGSPVLFRQPRPGRGGRIFTVVKFRSMRDACGPDGRPLADAERLTEFGRRLRASSLDELPELWNVLRGEMSLVGPRPLLVEYLDYYTPEEAKRHNVRPGLTGWAQIHGRDELEIDEKAKLDGYYVEHLSFEMDVKCFFGTIVAVLDHDGVVEGGTGTLHEEEKKKK